MLDTAALPEFPAYSYQVLVLALAAITARVLPVSVKYHPIFFFALVTYKLGEKVNPDPKRNSSQLVISGFMGLISAILPLLAIIWFYIPLVEFPLFVDWLILWLCLTDQSNWKAQLKVKQALDKQQKLLARDRLSDTVLRDVSKLSPMGVAKASIESMLLHSAYQYFAILFWYLLLGPLFVLFYRLLAVLQQSWNIKLPAFKHFSKSINFLFTLISYLPVRLFAWSILLFRAPVKSFFKMGKTLRQFDKQYRCGSFCLFYAMSHSLKRQLAGPLFYGEQKVNRPRIGDFPPPEAADIQHCRRIIKETAMIWWIVIVISSVVIMISG
ncbi:cobalamin biosynthesis protein CobD/CbiB [Catenovulum sp. SX2]|uniref:cobalamin biosynthesis protein CobD/CbiB n=1 Tax=Catenovulum sp. SX2 TaxID=3398614 RepID=UPI003F85774C